MRGISSRLKQDLLKDSDMKIRELRQKSKEELARILWEKRNSLLSLRFDISGGRVKNVKSMHEAKKDIARILTLLKQ